MPRLRSHLVRRLVQISFKRLYMLLLFLFAFSIFSFILDVVIHWNHLLMSKNDVDSFKIVSSDNLERDVPSNSPDGYKPSTLSRRSDTLKVEAFLDKTAPSVEVNIAIMESMLNIARIKRILFRLGTQTPEGRVLVLQGWVSSKSTEEIVLKSDKSLQTKPMTAVTGKNCHFVSPEWRKRNTCSRVPPVGGRLRLDVSLHNRTDVEELLRRSPYLRGRGSWTPRDCVPQHRVALIIPYRDRLEHLSTLLYTLHPLLQRQLLEYRVYVVEQYGNETFNKGVLMNAGVREALRDNDFHCFVFHDVDMIPEDDRNLYSCPEMPRHLSVAVDKFNYTLPYALLVGGVFSIRLEHFLAVNGYSNLYWGWGGEDDDMAYRIRYRKLEIIRPPETLARYSMIKHDHRPESPNAIRTALLRMAKKRSSRDGLNTVKYRVVWRHEHLAYTHLMVDIGKHHRWQFLNGQRLIINF
ncbi:unnamed protein product [Larinioides sclopetarius]|uniref:Beta-1,4-N-acetylgalactosaminyltransferase n=2 Tax=Larinioides sclopetarius TaxID=280406 RepID=A0AAV2BJ62_9ARAC